MATEEARRALDGLMGADRNAPLPIGAAVPIKSSRHGTKRNRDDDAGATGGGGLVLPGKRFKSCYDKDIDPLYTAWGIDVYELFINTKSDLGTNPYIVDIGAHEEYTQKLSKQEQDRLGYRYFLFQKLLELVRQCDRTVNRNKEKLKQELSRKLSQRGGQDFVEDVDDAAIDVLAENIIQLESYMEELHHKLQQLNTVVQEEEMGKNKLEPLLVQNKNKQEKNSEDSGGIEQEQQSTSESPIKKEDENSDVVVAAKEEEILDEETDVKVMTNDDKVKIKQDDDDGGVGVDNNEDNTNMNDDDYRIRINEIQHELGQLTLQRQRLLYDIGRIMTLLSPLQDTVETQRRQLNYVRSDISTDKTVCDVSGNFMSARDADERIAAHYAGKQYVGWKLVRDKLQSMIKQYGHYGPSPPGRAAENNTGPPPSAFGGGGARRGGSSSGGGGGGGRFDGGGGGGRFDGGGGGGRYDGGGGGYRGGPPPPNRPGGGPPERGRWERGGGGGGPSSYPQQDRGPRGPPPPRGGGGDWRR